MKALFTILFCALIFVGCRDHTTGHSQPGHTHGVVFLDSCDLVPVEKDDCYRLGEGVLLQIRDDETVGCFEFDVDILDEEDAFTIGITKDWKELVLIRFNDEGATILFQSVQKDFAFILDPVDILLTKKGLRQYRLGVEICYKLKKHHDHDDDHDDKKEGQD